MVYDPNNNKSIYTRIIFVKVTLLVKSFFMYKIVKFIISSSDCSGMMGRGAARGQVRGGMIGQVRHPSPVMQPIRRGRGAMNKVQNTQLPIQNLIFSLKFTVKQG